jgi:hypothetical protein
VQAKFSPQFCDTSPWVTARSPLIVPTGGRVKSEMEAGADSFRSYLCQGEGAPGGADRTSCVTQVCRPSQRVWRAVSTPRREVETRHDTMGASESFSGAAIPCTPACPGDVHSSHACREMRRNEGCARGRPVAGTLFATGCCSAHQTTESRTEIEAGAARIRNHATAQMLVRVTANPRVNRGPCCHPRRLAGPPLSQGDSLSLEAFGIASLQRVLVEPQGATCAEVSSPVQGACCTDAAELDRSCARRAVEDVHCTSSTIGKRAFE